MGGYVSVSRSGDLSWRKNAPCEAESVYGSDIYSDGYIPAAGVYRAHRDSHGQRNAEAENSDKSEHAQAARTAGWIAGVPRR